MNVRKVVILAFVVGCVKAAPVGGVLIEVSNIWPEPLSPCTVVPQDTLFRFDLVVRDAQGFSATGFQATIGISGPGILTGSDANSLVVATNAKYWLFENSAGAVFKKNDDGSYTFGDDPSNAVKQTLEVDEIMARYAFTWGGTEGFYTFTLSPDLSKTYIQDELYAKVPLNFLGPKNCQGDISHSFEVYIPEPSTLALIGLGGLLLRKKRRQ